MPAFKYVARFDGQIVGTRTSAAQRIYTHAVVAQGRGKDPHVVTWCGRPDLAQKERNKWHGYGYQTTVVAAERVDQVAQAPAGPASWKVEVQADSTGTWAGNGMRYPNRDQAEQAAKDLMWRWTAVREWRVVTSEDPPNT